MSNSIARWALLGVACLGVLAGCGREQGPPSPAPTDDPSTSPPAALRLLVPRLSPDSAASGDCTMPGSYELTIAGQQPIALTGCSSMPNRDFDLAGVVVVLENLMDSVID